MISPPHKHAALKHLKKSTQKGLRMHQMGQFCFSKKIPPAGGDTPPALSPSTALPSRLRGSVAWQHFM